MSIVNCDQCGALIDSDKDTDCFTTGNDGVSIEAYCAKCRCKESGHDWRHDRWDDVFYCAKCNQNHPEVPREIRNAEVA